MRHPINAPVCPERCNKLVARSPSRTARGSVARRFATHVGVGQGDVRRSEPSYRDHDSSTIIRGGFEGCRVGEASNPCPRFRRLLRLVEGRDASHKTTRIVALQNEIVSPRRQAIMVSTRRRTVRTILMSRRACARYGLRGVRVGEASHPGPRQGVRRAASVPEDVLDDLEAALTRIDSSATDDEPLVRPSSGRNVVPRRSTAEGSQGGGRLRRLRVVSSSFQDVGSTVLETASLGDVRGSESPIASTVQASSRAIRVRHGSPQVSSTVPDSRISEGRGQRDRPESQGHASSGMVRMVHNRFQVLAEEDGQEGVDDLEFFGGRIGHREFG